LAKFATSCSKEAHEQFVTISEKLKSDLALIEPNTALQSKLNLIDHLTQTEHYQEILGEIIKLSQSLSLKSTVSLKEMGNLLDELILLKNAEKHLTEKAVAHSLQDAQNRGLSVDDQLIKEHIELAKALANQPLDEYGWRLLTRPDWHEKISQRDGVLHNLAKNLHSYQAHLDRMRQLTTLDESAAFGQPLAETLWSMQLERLLLALTEPDTLRSLILYERARSQITDEILVQPLIRQGVPELALANRVEYWVIYHLVLEAMTKYPILREFDRVNHENLRQRYRDINEQLTTVEQKILVNKLQQRNPPTGNSRGPTSGYTERALIEHQIGLQRIRIPIRKLLQQASKAALALKPCFLMSPLSVGQFLDPNSITFDTVIIDEASQMLPEDALSAILRGRQLVVVGDPEQLPPTTFFAFSEVQTDYGEDTELDKPEDSILDLAKNRYKPMRELLWHYRSRHQSLIAFSNHHFYDDRLIIFPSPIAKDEVVGVRSILVKGEYRTGTGLNIPEAKKLIEEVITFMAKHPGLSIGIATINIRQADYIRQEFDRYRQEDPIVETYIESWQNKPEEFFVKNLENVQGDERDAIFISTVYGPDDTGKVHQRFGPINQEAGYRRLNVLFTRAKHHICLVTSMKPSDVLPGPNSHRGVHILQDYLEYASSGKLQTGSLTGGEPESDFERFVIARLHRAGYKASCQVGVAGYRVDIGVQHPENPNVFILGVECDGASYHSSRFARDRDKIRQEILESLGWTLHRIWSADWFADPEREFERLIVRIEETLASYNKQYSSKLALQTSSSSTEASNDQEEFESLENALALITLPSAPSIPLAVRVGDRVTYVVKDDPNEIVTVVIGSNDGSWIEGESVTLESPVAKGLLGRHIGEIAILERPVRRQFVGKPQEVIIKNIERQEG
jgi:very-short-patch-repair endonuclease